MHGIQQALPICLPSLLSHQLQRTIRLHREVLRISNANILPCQCHAASALNFGCAFNKKLFSRHFEVFALAELPAAKWLIEEGANKLDEVLTHSLKKFSLYVRLDRTYLKSYRFAPPLDLTAHSSTPFFLFSTRRSTPSVFSFLSHCISVSNNHIVITR